MEQNNTLIQQVKILKIYGINERLCREGERKNITGISRTDAYLMEKKGEFPKRLSLSAGRIAWRLSDLLIWINSREGKCNGEK